MIRMIRKELAVRKVRLYRSHVDRAQAQGTPIAEFARACLHERVSRGDLGELVERVRRGVRVPWEKLTEGYMIHFFKEDLARVEPLIGSSEVSGGRFSSLVRLCIQEHLDEVQPR